jgi:Eco57I restriction-modification methylase
MRLERALAECRALSDLPALIDALGGEPRFAEFSPSILLGASAQHSGIDGAAEVGRFGSLPCIGVVATAPEMIAGRVARRLARRGEPALVVAVGTRTGTLVVAIGADPTATLTIDGAAPDGIALASLKRLREDHSGGRAAVALRIAERLVGRRADHHFFTAFREARDRLAAEGPLHATPGDRRALALLQLTRVLFLYFIQQKGWLDGRPDFLPHAVDTHLGRGRSLARDLLRPLFFGLLNRPGPERSSAVRRFGRVPFLNGGLFEPHPLEHRWRFDHSNTAWRGAFDELFERFHFTLDERIGDRSIAPDMLGRVFEGLMAAEERKVTGTFYTPVRLVNDVVASGASSLIAERLGIDREEAADHLASRTPEAALVLARCRVLDPAVGSGAFLLGALDLFAQIGSVHDPAPGHRRRILRERLYGVDLSAEAVRLAELRLWLAAVRDDEGGAEAEIAPLPNLDATLRQGDTLHDPRWLAGLRRVPRATSKELSEARRHFAGESGPGKRAAWRTLRAAEQRAACEALAEAGTDLDGRIAHLLADARSPDLFGRRRGLDAPLRAALDRARNDRRRVRDATRRLAREGALPWFDATSCFGEVFAERGGFDLVVGNPPWVRAEEVPQRTRDALAERYRWWRADGTRGYAHRPDLSVAFLERSLELCAPGGVLAMLVPSKLLTSGYGTEARCAMARDLTVDLVATLSPEAADAFAAVTYPLALVIRKRRPQTAHRIRVDAATAPTVLQSELSGAPWVLRSPAAGRVVGALRARWPSLGSAITIHLGVKCGLNEAFLSPPASVEPEVIREAVRGRDLAPFQITSTIRLLYPHDRRGRPLPKLPPQAERHLTSFASALAARADARNGPWWALHRTGPASAAHRVAWPDLARALGAVQLPRTVIPLNSCYLVVTKSHEAGEAFAAWLNSTWIGAVARLGADPARGGFFRFNARTVGAVPLPTAALEDERWSRLPRPQRFDKEARDAIDRIVAEHLGLDARDRRALRAVG